MLLYLGKQLVSCWVTDRLFAFWQFESEKMETNKKQDKKKKPVLKMPPSSQDKIQKKMEKKEQKMKKKMENKEEKTELMEDIDQMLQESESQKADLAGGKDGNRGSQL